MDGELQTQGTGGKSLESGRVMQRDACDRYTGFYWSAQGYNLELQYSSLPHSSNGSTGTNTWRGRKGMLTGVFVHEGRGHRHLRDRTKRSPDSGHVLARLGRSHVGGRCRGGICCVPFLGQGWGCSVPLLSLFSTTGHQQLPP